VASRSLGTAAAAPPQPADCIAMAARDICAYGASTACFDFCSLNLSAALVCAAIVGRVAFLLRSSVLLASVLQRATTALVLDRV
jgi:hypothetical protein